MRVHYDDDLEKIVTSVLGAIGTVAIIVNLLLKGITPENTLDAVKDIAGLIITVIVFMIASRVLRKPSMKSFTDRFESYLREWAEQNVCLIDPDSAKVEKGKDNKRAYTMVVDHTSFINGTPASKCKKGAFLYLPLKDELGNPKAQIEFRVNESTFKRQDKYITPSGKPDLKSIVVDFSLRIQSAFGDQLKIKAYPKPDDKEVIVIDLSELEKTTENAKKLIDMVEFVKTLYLALA
ncbi:MAG TPA: hypothetical protein PL188_04035 [Candidatus Cloacimonadota bacterium]|jgi:hypothetical protein|nr:hypothetical protein [Candidatus Cloacimonadota bacterium]HOH97462.1 hypothetical protein [Candidatus Cloacimonadota bacterium]